MLGPMSTPLVCPPLSDLAPIGLDELIGELSGLPVYWVGQSTTRFWLYREFRDVPDVGGEVARETVERAARQLGFKGCGPHVAVMPRQEGSSRRTSVPSICAPARCANSQAAPMVTPQPTLRSAPMGKLALCRPPAPQTSTSARCRRLTSPPSSG